MIYGLLTVALGCDLVVVVLAWKKTGKRSNGNRLIISLRGIGILAMIGCLGDGVI